jgi:hypothetical protein
LLTSGTWRDARADTAIAFTSIDCFHRSETMIKSHVVAALLALGSLTVLPGCGDHIFQPAPVAVSSSPELSPGMVRQVQNDLQQQGLYKGNIDGIWGPETRSAVQAYQQAHGLSGNGELNSATMASLNIPAPPPAAPTAAAPATATPMAAAPMTVGPAAAAPAAGPPMAGTTTVGATTAGATTAAAPMPAAATQ